jgi:hypothetical protein
MNEWQQWTRAIEENAALKAHIRSFEAERDASPAYAEVVRLLQINTELVKQLERWEQKAEGLQRERDSLQEALRAAQIGRRFPAQVARFEAQAGPWPPPPAQESGGKMIDGDWNRYLAGEILRLAKEVEKLEDAVTQPEAGRLARTDPRFTVTEVEGKCYVQVRNTDFVVAEFDLPAPLNVGVAE